MLLFSFLILFVFYVQGDLFFSSCVLLGFLFCFVCFVFDRHMNILLEDILMLMCFFNKLFLFAFGNKNVPNNICLYFCLNCVFDTTSGAYMSRTNKKFWGKM